jgi:cyclophilin family peptidyl-prolyl cis-trans isomerase
MAISSRFERLRKDGRGCEDLLLSSRGRTIGAGLSFFTGGGFLALIQFFAIGCAQQGAAHHQHSLLLDPNAPEMNATAPAVFEVRLETSKGPIKLEIHRDWAPHGADHFYNLVRGGYYDDVRFSRVIAGRWAQFGINGDPRIAKVWRKETIPDDPRHESNLRGTIAYAFAVPNGRTTQVFINLRDNSATHDPEPFVPFGRVVEGMEVADALNAEYGDKAGGGIRAGKQGPVFDGGNDYLTHHFPRLDYIKRAVVLDSRATTAVQK